MKYNETNYLNELKFGKELIETINFNNPTIDDLVKLKKFYKNINNLITYKVAVKGITWLKDCNFISNEEDWFNSINNSKGYDIHIPENEIIAEVKCNIPVKINKFGPNQQDGIIKDIKGLLSGKGKFENQTSNLKKFLFIYNTDGIENALKNLIAIKKFEHSNKTKIIKTSSEFNLNNVNVVIIK